MGNRIFKIAYLVFFSILVLIIILNNFDFVSFGVDIINPIGVILCITILIISIIVFIAVNFISSENLIANLFRGLLILSMVIISIFFITRCHSYKSIHLARKQTYSVNNQSEIISVIKDSNHTISRTDSNKAIKQASLVNTCLKPNKIDPKYFNLASISADDSSIIVGSDKYLEYQIFGYQNPDTSSKKMILISCFKYDVSTNIYKCPYGAYYHINGTDSISLKYLSKNKKFIKAAILKDHIIIDKVFIERQFVHFEKD